MNFILRLFGDYRRLVEEHREARDSRAEMQGLVNELREEVRCLKEERDKAIGEERSAYQMLINVEYKKLYGITPFPNAPSIPDIAADLTPVGGTVSARMATRAGREAFRADLKSLVEGDVQ